MDKLLIEQLKNRNTKIIEAVIEKSRKVCPGSIALIGIAGSFYTGDIHEKSDLDLCIVINDDAGWKIWTCFILGDVAHDIYCTPWEKLEYMCEYNDPYITNLIDLDIVYCADEKYLERYMDLRKEVKDKLAAPITMEDIRKINRHFEDAKKEYVNIMLCANLGNCKYYAAEMIYYLEYVIYMANKTYVKKGVKRIPEELKDMKMLPNDFLEKYHHLINAVSLKEIQVSATELVKTTKEFLEELKDSITTKKEITLKSLEGSYEEIYSNWLNKMYYAADNNDIYLALMTMASCQNFYNEIFDEYDIEPINLFNNFKIDNLSGLVEVFNEAMEKYKGLYKKLEKSVKYYKSIEDFEDDYLK